MNKKHSGILFVLSVLFYSFVMALSYTSCNSENTGNSVASTTATDSSNMTPSDTSAKKTTSTKKVRKGKASVSMTATNGSEKKIKDKNGVYMRPDKMPEYPGGESALSAYIQSTLSYPQLALDYNKEGTVRVSFIVDQNGNVESPAVLGQKLGDGLDEEAIDIVKKMPKWKPGYVKGKTVKTRMALPITFQIQEES